MFESVGDTCHGPAYVRFEAWSRPQFPLVRGRSAPHRDGRTL